jgi:hypothetical protein
MTLDEQLRAALNLEAEMSIAPPPPDADVLISGGQARRRHRNAGRLGLLAAAVVLVGGGGYAVTQHDSGKARTGPAVVGQVNRSPGITAVPPGSRETVGVDRDSGRPISIVVPENARLFGGGTGVTPANPHANHVGLDVFQARALAGGSSACSDDTWFARSRQPDETALGLSRQLELLPGGTLIQPLTPTTAFGYDAFHLRVRVNNGCPAGQAYLVAEADSDFGVNYSDVPKDVVIDFLVVDVEGTPIVTALWHEVGSSSHVVHRAAMVRDSISFVTGP